MTKMPSSKKTQSCLCQLKYPSVDGNNTTLAKAFTTLKYTVLQLLTTRNDKPNNWGKRNVVEQVHGSL